MTMYRSWNIDDVPIFVAVVENKSVSAAAQQLSITKSTVSKSLSRLEDALGTRLLERNSRNIRITSEGAVFYRQALLIIEQVTETDAIMAGLTSTPSGKLYIALPMAFAREIFAPHLKSFRKQYPKIDLEIIITSHPVDIIRDQIDVAVVVGSLDNSELIVKRLYESRLLWVSSPGYIETNTLGSTYKELLPHIHICEKRYGMSHFPIRIDGHRTSIDLNRNIIHANDPIVVREAVINGFGVSMLPDQYCKTQLKNGQLVKVFDNVDIDSSASELSAIYPSRRLLSNKTRAVLDFLADICSSM